MYNTYLYMKDSWQWCALNWFNRMFHEKQPSIMSGTPIRSLTRWAPVTARLFLLRRLFEVRHGVTEPRAEKPPDVEFLKGVEQKFKAFSPKSWILVGLLLFVRYLTWFDQVAKSFGV